MINETPGLQSILDRLSRLERQNRRLKWCGFIFLVGFSTVFLMGQASAPRIAQVVEAQRFVLRDANGRPRAMLGVTGDESVSLIFASPNQAPVLGLTASRESSGFALYGPDKKPRVTLSMSARGTGLFIDGQEGKPGAEIGIAPDGFPILAIFAKQDHPLAFLGLRDDGSPSFALNAPDGKNFSLFTVNGLAVAGNKGQRRVGLGVMPDGSPNMTLFDDGGNVRAVVGTYDARAESSMVLLDRNSKVIWSAP